MQGRGLRSGSLGRRRQVDAGVSGYVTEGEGPASGQAGSGDGMSVRQSDGVLPAVDPSTGPSRCLSPLLGMQTSATAVGSHG